MANFRLVFFRFCAALIAVTFSCVFCRAFAGVLAVNSYDMPNGAGQASGAGPAGFNYWDGTYNGSGNVHQDSAPLSGGVGALTDGIISTQPFYLVENAAGTGPYVGWAVNPVTIDFHLVGTPTISSVLIFVDNSESDVVTPSSIAINGTPEQFTITNIGVTAQELAISGLHLIGPDVTVTLGRSTGGWIFASEIQFLGVSSAVPEPSTWAMMLIGFAGLCFAFRQSRRKVSFA
jgi:hypothetical protein